LKTAIPDIARLLRSGEQVAFLQTYFSPEQLNQLDPQFIERLQKKQQQEQADFAQHPEDRRVQEDHQILQQECEGAAEIYEAIEDQTPALNDTGDEATYNTSMGGTMALTTIVFVKINGKWYVKGGPIGPG
jgi:hypothetical protein